MAVITAVVIMAVSLLFFTQGCTQAKLDLQSDQETVGMLQTVFPEADSYALEEDIYIVYENSRDKTGYAFIVEDIGYTAWYTILVGLYADLDTIAGINVMEHGETYGWGYSQGPPVDMTEFAAQYFDLKVEDCAPTESGGMVDAVSGASTGSGKMIVTIKESILEKIAIIETQ